MPKRTREPVLLIPHHSRMSGLFRKEGQFIADIKPDGGKRTVRLLGTDREQALRRYDELMTELSHHENPELAPYLWGTFLPSQRVLKDYAYAERCIRMVTRYLDARAPGLRLREVKRLHVDGLREHYSHCSPRTINMYTQKMKQALNYAVDVGLLSTNPIARVKMLPVDNRRMRFIVMDDFIRILHEARNTDAHDLFVVGGVTGLRPSNVRLLSKDEVDGDIIRIPGEKMKNGRWGIIPASQEVISLLSQRDPAPYYFPARHTTDTPKSMENLSRSFRTVIRRLDGLEWSTLYDLRHFFASQLAKQGANEQQIGRLLCHVSGSVTSRYVHQDIEDLRGFVDELGRRYVAARGAQV
jgi:integrase